MLDWIIEKNWNAIDNTASLTLMFSPEIDTISTIYTRAVLIVLSVSISFVKLLVSVQIAIEC